MGASMEACAGESCSFTATDRQIEVLVLLASGLRDSEIAEELRISPHTVVHHVKTLQRKLAAPNRPSLIALAIAAGIIDASMWPVISTNRRCALVRPNRCPRTGREAD
jgi:DNA-binding CsgD family transcriptional regulator